MDLNEASLVLPFIPKSPHTAEGGMFSNAHHIRMKVNIPSLVLLDA